MITIMFERKTRRQRKHRRPFLKKWPAYFALLFIVVIPAAIVLQMLSN